MFMNFGHEENTYNIGWIEELDTADTGIVPSEFFDALWEYIKCPFNCTRGMHCNTYLDKESSYYKAVYYDSIIMLGTAEIRVIDKVNKCIYAAPDLVLHYVISHKYCPPIEFVEAVIHGPKPNSIEYAKMVSQMYKDIPEKINSKLICPYCRTRKSYFLPRIRKKHKMYDKIMIVNTSYNEMDKLTEYDFVYPSLCQHCGKIFEIEYDVIHSWIDERQ